MFRLSEVAAAVGIELRTLPGWIDRRLIDIPASGSGHHRRFDRDDVNRIAIISALVRLGVSVSDAAKAASAYSDDCDGIRDVGDLYTEGQTFLILDEDGARCINVSATREEFESAMASVYSETHGAVVINVGAVIAAAERALKGQPARPPAAAIFRHGRQMHLS